MSRALLTALLIGTAVSALADEKVKAAIEGKQIVKVIVVPGKLVNIVVR